MRRTRKHTHERGQVLVLFAGGMFGLLALAALAIDLSSVYSTQQMEKAAADAAALAGAQDLQATGSRALGDPVTVRKHALEDLAGRFGVDVPDPRVFPACSPAADITDCQLTDTYHVAISTPSKTPTTSDPRSIQVTVSNPNFQLSFARLFGQNGWNVGKASVAVIDYPSQYATIMLQPPQPKPNNTDANICKDIIVDGNNTLLNVLQGDIGTNSSATTTNAGEIRLANNYWIAHMDDLSFGGCSYTTPGASWSTDASGLPKGKPIGPSPLLQDPLYPVASFAGVTPYASQADGAVTVPCTASSLTSDLATQALLTPPSGGTLTCYNPGIYSGKFSVNSNNDIAYLMPGAYEFLGGMDMGGTLVGGMNSKKALTQSDRRAGVVLVFPQTTRLNPNNSVNIMLNMGDVSCLTDSCGALPAVDSAGKTMATPDGVTLTIEVPRDGGCFSGTNPQNAGCSVNQNQTISLAGAGFIRVAGVIYAPSDNVQVAGNATQTGYAGQIVAWSVKYSGGGLLEQEYPGPPGNGILRLDTVCSGGNTPCNP
jgi:hypothetical protein